jgi:hypothetical protein
MPKKKRFVSFAESLPLHKGHSIGDHNVEDHEEEEEVE